MLRALGLIEGKVDMDAVARQQASGVIGFYDSRTKELYVRGVDATASTEQTLVHELTHASTTSISASTAPSSTSPSRATPSPPSKRWRRGTP